MSRPAASGFEVKSSNCVCALAFVYVCARACVDVRARVCARVCVSLFVDVCMRVYE